MARFVTTIRELGRDTSWMLVQQALGIPDAKMPSDYMDDMVALLLFAQPSLPERLCVTAAVRQMGGSTIYQGNQGEVWRQEMHMFQEHLLPIFSYYMDCMYIYGLPITHLDCRAEHIKFPVINAGSPEAHPAHALADIACMLKAAKNLDGVMTAWIGCDNGTLHSLVEAMAWFPFAMNVCLPPQIDSSMLRKRIDILGVPVQFVKSPMEAVKGARFVYAGCRAGLGENELAGWEITPELMRQAEKDARLLLSASPVRAIHISPEVLSSPASRLRRQAEFRLCVHKRILHWVLEKQ